MFLAAGRSFFIPSRIHIKKKHHLNGPLFFGWKCPEKTLLNYGFWSVLKIRMGFKVVLVALAKGWNRCSRNGPYMAAGWAKMCGSWSREATQKEVALNLGNPERLWWLLTWLEIPSFFSKKWSSTIDLSCFFAIFDCERRKWDMRWRFGCSVFLRIFWSLDFTSHFTHLYSCGLQNFNYPLVI